MRSHKSNRNSYNFFSSFAISPPFGVSERCLLFGFCAHFYTISSVQIFSLRFDGFDADDCGWFLLFYFGRCRAVYYLTTAPISYRTHYTDYTQCCSAARLLRHRIRTRTAHTMHTHNTYHQNTNTHSTRDFHCVFSIFYDYYILKSTPFPQEAKIPRDNFLRFFLCVLLSLSHFLSFVIPSFIGVF